MSDRVLAPIVIGVTGKLDLNGREEWVRKAMQQLFQRLDHEYGDTQKILLCALAEGADTIAAEEALKRKDWRLVARLPLPLDLYLEDFSETGAARLRALLQDPKVKSETLLTLLDDPSGGKPLETEVLHRQPDASNPQRTDHYEQVGLFIADRATLLIAVMPVDEQPGRIGGTARIVRYRLRGPFDDASRDVLARSRELRPPELLDDAHSGPIWLIDPTAPAAREDFPATVLLPPDRRISRPRTQRRRINASLVVIDRLNRFNRRVLAMPEERWQRDVAGKAGRDFGDATSMLRYLRRTMSAVQGDANRKRKFSIVALAVLFWLAAAAVELREGFWILKDWWWRAYFLFGVVAVVIYWLASRGFWQQISEDYRAVAEALRVQIAWWDSGLRGPEDRVERLFLRGSSGALALVRAAVRHFVDVALLLRAPPPTSEHSAEDWIKDQIKFFEARISARRRYLLAVDTSTWLFFLGSLGSAALLVLSPIAPSLFARFFGWLEASWVDAYPGKLFLETLGVLALLSLGAVCLQVSGILRRIEHRYPFMRLLLIIVVVVMGMAFAASLFDLAKFLLNRGMLVNVASDPLVKALAERYCPPAQDFKTGTSPDYIVLGQAFAELFAVVPAAIAGAVRYLAEKLSWEAELHGYEDTLRTFRRARDVLPSAAETESDANPNRPRRRDLLVALGKEALEESEGWIRAHRERLIEPAV